MLDFDRSWELRVGRGNTISFFRSSCSWSGFIDGSVFAAWVHISITDVMHALPPICSDDSPRILVAIDKADDPF